MPLPQLSRQEVRLGRFAAFCSALYAVLGLVFAFFPGWTFRLAGLGARAELTAEVRFWQVLGVAMMAAISVACALVAHSPRERRVALLPVLAGQLTCSAMALLLVVGFAPAGWRESAWRAVFLLVRRLDLFFRRLRVQQPRPRLRDGDEDVALLLRETFDRLDQVGNEIVPALQLYLHFRPRRLHRFFLTRELVVRAARDRARRDQNEDERRAPDLDRHEHGLHFIGARGALRLRARRTRARYGEISP